MSDGYREYLIDQESKAAERQICEGGHGWLAGGQRCKAVDDLRAKLEAAKALLAEAAEHLQEHDQEYHHRTPVGLLERVEAMSWSLNSSPSSSASRSQRTCKCCGREMPPPASECPRCLGGPALRRHI